MNADKGKVKDLTQRSQKKSGEQSEKDVYRVDAEHAEKI
jgi:hypothetical protein